ncbi:MmgE/PrpD family protein [Bordetella genomosp. 13]|uniref:MmgE/PrpD family protein n=1 Tax=Bordetella genomosp. 13 TaxID=463040 RepID=A0A1W6ZD26_9BORD|nr:MmgE/PrpD family protein [Bordetella genomosp. 13]
MHEKNPDAAVHVTGPLARFTAQCRWQDVPEAVRHEARRSLMNFFAVALAPAHDPTLDIALRTYARYSANDRATVIGRRARVDILTAAALNAMAANVYDFDDTHHPTIIHPTAPVAPALFALAEERPMRGEDLLLAFVLGVEAACRIGNAMSPEHYARGWHITSTCGVFGSALAVGKRLGLGEQALTWALASAAVQAGGLVETLGTMAKSVSVGNAARNGLLSALLAEEGFDGPPCALEGERGYLRVAASSPDIAPVAQDLGTRWEILNNTYKPYPCGVVLNPVIEACLDLSRDERYQRAGVGSVQSVLLVGHPLLRQRTDRPGIRTGRQSQVSAQHAVAAALVRGRAGLDEFSDEAVAEPALRALGERVRFRDDEACSVDAVQVRVELADGQVLVRDIEAAQGSRARPLSDAALEDKLRTLCRHGGSGVDAERLIAAVWELEQAPDAAQVIRLAAA